MTSSLPRAQAGAGHITVRPITGTMGAELVGLDLSQPLSPDELSAVKSAFAEHLVLVFRDQQLDIAALERFALQFGPFGDTPYITPVEGHPNVLRVLREAQEEGALFGGSWHSDWSFQECPPSATILYAVDVPDHGGDTAFTNQYLAYETLSPGMKRLLEGVNGVHSARLSYAPGGTFGRPDSRRSMEIHGSEDALAYQLHPLVRRHPESGRRALFINEVYTIGLEDMTEAESKSLLDHLLAHSRQVSFTCRVKWRPGTLTMWDNRCTQHHAIDDYTGHRREMLRITIAGEKPVA